MYEHFAVANEVGVDDYINVGAGNNMVDAGDGSDKIYTGSGNDRVEVVTAGTGTNSFNGDAGDDILIAGSTSTESDEAALALILAQWSAADAEPASLGTVSDDASDIDTLYGRTGIDRFWANQSVDLLLDYDSAIEILTEIP